MKKILKSIYLILNMEGIFQKLIIKELNTIYHFNIFFVIVELIYLNKYFLTFATKNKNKTTFIKLILFIFIIQNSQKRIYIN